MASGERKRPLKLADKILNPLKKLAMRITSGCGNKGRRMREETEQTGSKKEVRRERNKRVKLKGRWPRKSQFKY